MFSEGTYGKPLPFLLLRIKDYGALFKLRLTFLVMLSSVFGFLLAVDTVIWGELGCLVLGGFLVTGASNAVNQILEKDLDAKMARTAQRPLASGRIMETEALIVSVVSGLSGIFLLWYFLNPLSGILGALSLFVYTFLYTPLKQKTPFAVFVGAFPGAVPPMLGWVAASGNFGPGPGSLFAMQFMWQFPHFWAIAWVMHEDYEKAGFRLLPSRGGRDKSSAFQILLYSLFVTPAALLPIFFGVSGSFSAYIVIGAGILLLLPAWKLYFNGRMEDAKRVMYASFIYLPLVQVAYVIDKV